MKTTFKPNTKSFTSSFLFALALLFSLSSCTKEKIVPSGQITSVEHSVMGFDGIEINGSITAKVKIAETEKVVLELNQNLHQHVDVYVENGTLIVEPKKNVNISGSAHMVVYIDAEYLWKMHANGASRIECKSIIESTNLSIDLNGASRLDASVEVSTLGAKISGASDLQLEGTSSRFELDASGASEMGFYDFSTDDFVGDLSGASSAYLHVNNTLSVNASGASYVYYKGNAVIQHLDLSGASQVVNMN